MATSPSRLSGSLQHFRLNGVRDTGITVGDGAYATVLQYDFRGLKCVGKKIHRLLYEHASHLQRADMLRRFEEECKLLGRLHHPNIVQFLGVHVEEGSELPVLVMEYLPTNLSDYLDRHGVQRTEISYGILRDVALGLRYLHGYSPPIVHRDLSANNVLLTASLSAKISDLGVAKILNITPSKMTQQMSTKAPGTPCYMPPEALIAQPRYTRKIDSYSFGVLILHVLCGEWPFPSDPFQCDPNSPGIFRPVPVTEAQRRAQFLQKVDRDHPLLGLVRQCLSNAPDERPDSIDIFQQISTALCQVPTHVETAFQQLEGLRSENQRLGAENHRLGNENQTLGSENQRQKTEIQRLENENQRLGNKNRSITIEIQDLRREIQILESEIQTLKEHSQTQPSSSHATVNQPLVHEVETLSGCDFCLSLHPEVRLQWRKCADAPVTTSSAHVVVVGENIYMGGGGTDTMDDAFLVFQYNWRGNMWNTLSCCPVRLFGMAHFMGRIITVGGKDSQGSLTGKVHALREDSQQWEEFLVPMPTARCDLTVATTTFAIISAGGRDAIAADPACSSTVEVYSSDTSQWHHADPLPNPCVWMSSTTIDSTCYLLGGTTQNLSGIKGGWYASLSSLTQKATSSTPYPVSESVWKHISPTPHRWSAAACLGGCLVAMGGRKDDNTRSSAVYAFLKNSWVRLRKGDLLSPRSSCATAQLSPVSVIVIGGYDEQSQTSKTVFIGTLQS